jgi:hypothetical protein
MANVLHPSFWRDTAERAVKTFIQTFAATLAIPAVTEIFSVSAWKSAVVAAAAGALSVVSSLVSKRVGDPESASVVD